MARSHLIAALAAAGLTAAVISAPGQAAMAVFDGTLIGKAVEQLTAIREQIGLELEQLNVLREQIDFLNDISRFANDITQAIGQVTNITLPTLDLDQVAGQLRRDLQCLMPDGAGWGITFKPLSIGSICQATDGYRTALFLDLEGEANGGSIQERNAARQTVKIRRAALLGDTAVRSIATADMNLKQIDGLGKAADTLERQAEAAETLQERAAVQIQAQVLIARTLAAQNQMLAQMLRLQGAQMVAGSPVDPLDAAGLESPATGDGGLWGGQ